MQTKLPYCGDSSSEEYSLVVTTPHTLELVKDAIVLVEIAQLPAEVVMDRDRFQRSILHVDIPDLEVEVVARQDVSPVSTELHV